MNMQEFSNENRERCGELGEAVIEHEGD